MLVSLASYKHAPWVRRPVNHQSSSARVVVAAVRVPLHILGTAGRRTGRYSAAVVLPGVRTIRNNSTVLVSAGFCVGVRKVFSSVRIHSPPSQDTGPRSSHGCPVAICVAHRCFQLFRLIHWGVVALYREHIAMDVTAACRAGNPGLNAVVKSVPESKANT
jgi:hypothetical protein